MYAEHIVLSSHSTYRITFHLCKETRGGKLRHRQTGSLLEKITTRLNDLFAEKFEEDSAQVLSGALALGELYAEDSTSPSSVAWRESMALWRRTRTPVRKKSVWIGVRVFSALSNSTFLPYQRALVGGWRLDCPEGQERRSWPWQI